MMDVNYSGSLNVTKALLPAMQKSSDLRSERKVTYCYWAPNLLVKRVFRVVF